jgi:aspartate/methionine/tyrosine aminotransferase
LPDFETPDFVKSEAAEAIKLNHNQYARSAGHPLLVEALSKYYEPRLNRRVDPMTEIVIGNGATEATFATMQGLLNPGDEVILFEPFYDAYPEQVVF